MTRDRETSGTFASWSRNELRQLVAALGEDADTRTRGAASPRSGRARDRRPVNCSDSGAGLSSGTTSSSNARAHTRPNLLPAPRRLTLALLVVVLLVLGHAAIASADVGVADSWTKITDPSVCSQFAELVPCWRFNNDGGTVTNEVISDSSMTEMEDQLVASADEAMGTTVPSGIATDDAAVGTGLWDDLHSASEPLREGAFDTIGDIEGVDLIGSMPQIALAAGAFYVGYKVIGPAIANFLGISFGSPPQFQSNITAAKLAPCRSGRNFDDLCSKPGTSGSNQTYCSSIGQPPPQVAGNTCHDVAATSNGNRWVVLFSVNQGAAYEEDFANPNFCNDPSPPDLPPGTPTDADMALVATEQPAGCPANSAQLPLKEYAVTVPMTTTALPGPGQGGTTVGTQPCTPTTDASPGGCTVTSSLSTSNLPTLAQQRQNALATLTSPDPTQQGLNKHLCTVPGSPCYGWTPDSGAITLPAITPKETYQQWSDAARAAGLLGTITHKVLTDAQADPQTYPNAVARTSPAAGSQVDPSTSVTVYTNPDSSPTPGTQTGGGGGTGSGVEAPTPTGPTPPGISIPTAPTPCSIFPFGIPCWVANQLGGFAASAAAPAFSIGLPWDQTLTVDLNNPFGADLGSIMAVVRPVLLFVSFVALVIWLGGMAMGGSTGGGGGSEGEE